MKIREFLYTRQTIFNTAYLYDRSAVFFKKITKVLD
jgi:hypothetical protein